MRPRASRARLHPGCGMSSELSRRVEDAGLRLSDHCSELCTCNCYYLSDTLHLIQQIGQELPWHLRSDALTSKARKPLSQRPPEPATSTSKLEVFGFLWGCRALRRRTAPEPFRCLGRSGPLCLPSFGGLRFGRELSFGGKAENTDARFSAVSTRCSQNANVHCFCRIQRTTPRSEEEPFPRQDYAGPGLHLAFRGSTYQALDWTPGEGPES